MSIKILRLLNNIKNKNIKKIRISFLFRKKNKNINNIFYNVENVITAPQNKLKLLKNYRIR